MWILLLNNVDAIVGQKSDEPEKLEIGSLLLKQSTG